MWRRKNTNYCRVDLGSNKHYCKITFLLALVTFYFVYTVRTGLVSLMQSHDPQQRCPSAGCGVYLNITVQTLQKTLQTNPRVIEPQPHRLISSVSSCFHVSTVGKIEIVALLIFLTAAQHGQLKSLSEAKRLPLCCSHQEGTEVHHCDDLEAEGYCPLRKARWPLVHLLAQ